MAVEMDRTFIGSSPDAAAGAATGAAYSKMAYTSFLLAQFIRGLGYAAVPCGNDTALSIPLAIRAGLGEAGRNGLLITREFGSSLLRGMPALCLRLPGQSRRGRRQVGDGTGSSFKLRRKAEMVHPPRALLHLLEKKRLGLLELHQNMPLQLSGRDRTKN
jgi:hypothetical protein